MWSISELKMKGKTAFKNNYWRCVLVAFILSLLTAGSSASGSGSSVRNTQQMNNQYMIVDSEQAAAIFAAMAIVASFIVYFIIIWSVLRIFLLNPLEVGCYSFLKKNIEEPVDLNCLKDGFSNYKNSVVTLLLRDIFLALWFCLLFIPGVIKSYSYMMVPYILMDNPELSATEVITRSRQMMNGHKWRTFCLDLSFIGWGLLSILTCGLVGIFYSRPYRRSTRAALYHEIKDLV